MLVTGPRVLSLCKNYLFLKGTDVHSRLISRYACESKSNFCPRFANTIIPNIVCLYYSELKRRLKMEKKAKEKMEKEKQAQNLKNETNSKVSGKVEEEISPNVIIWFLTHSANIKSFLMFHE